MPDFYGRFFSGRDQNLISAINNELKNTITQVLLTIFKIAPNQTNINMYGEARAAEGKSFYPGIQIYGWVEREDLTEAHEGFGGDRDQDLTFGFTYEDLYNAQTYIQSGDYLGFNARYYEIEAVFNDKQLLGGQPTKNFSLIAKAHYTKLGNINLVSRQTP
jgi:hypothetical protein